MIAALLAIPWLIAAIGMERFGALTLIWALLGYLAVLDLGLVRALIQTVAERHGHDRAPPSAGIVGPAIAVIAVVGLATGGVLILVAGPISNYLIHASPALSAEIRHSLMACAVIAPVALVSAGLRGVLEATGQFRAVNLVRMTTGVLNYVSPLAALACADSLMWVMIAIAVGRLLGMSAYVWLCVRTIPDLLFPARYRREPLRPLFSMGLWMMLNNLLGPAMLYADRMILAGLVPAAAIAFYTTPFEMLTRLLFIPAAVSGVLFPAAAGLFRHDPQALGRMLDIGLHGLCGLFLLVDAAALFGGEAALRLWLGPVFAGNSALILSILTLGVLFNAVAYAPYALFLGIGRVDVTMRVQLAELPFYLAILWFFVDTWGPAGAAAAWSLRTGVDMFLLLYLLPAHAPGARPVVAAAAPLLAMVTAACAFGLILGGEAGVILHAAGLAIGVAGVSRRLLRLNVVQSIAGVLSGRAPPGGA